MVWKQKFTDGVERVKTEPHAYVYGSWCRWCPASAICPQLSKKALLQAQIEFDDERNKLSLPVISDKELPIANLSNILNACEKLELWIEKVRAYAFEKLEYGDTIDGWKLVQKRSIRKWSIEAPLVAKEVFGEIAFSEPELLSPAQLEKTKIKKKEVKDFIEKYAIAESSGLTMVKEGDKRAAVFRAQIEFTEG
jgi:hypothetical protein